MSMSLEAEIASRARETFMTAIRYLPRPSQQIEIAAMLADIEAHRQKEGLDLVGQVVTKAAAQ